MKNNNTISHSNKKIYVTCDEGHTYKRSAYLVAKGLECPECKKRRLSIANKPYIMKFWDYEKNKNLDPFTLFEYMKVKAHWKCTKCGYEWKSSIATRKNGLCPCCDVGTRIMPGFNDVLTVVPNLRKDFIQELNPGINLSKYGTGSKNIQIQWRCHVCGYEWKSTIFARVKNHKGKNIISKCPVCGKCKRTKSFIDDYPDLANIYSRKNEIPFNKIPGNYKQDYLWECKIHGTFKQKLSSMIRSRSSKYHGCPFCANKSLNNKNSLNINYPKIFNELSTTDNYLIADDNDYSMYSRKKLWWICPICGHKYSMSTNEKVSFYLREKNPCNNCKGIKRKVSHYV